MAEGFSAVHSRGYHFRILATLKEFGPASQAELGRRSGIHASEMVATINELVDRELVERAPDPIDRRRNIVTLTAAGEQQLGQLEKQLARCQDDLLAPLAIPEREQLVELLSKLLDYHDSRGGTSE